MGSGKFRHPVHPILLWSDIEYRGLHGLAAKGETFYGVRSEILYRGYPPAGSESALN